MFWCCAVLCCDSGLGLRDNGTMGAHHLATVALVVLSYMLNVHLLGRWLLGAPGLSH
jgi:hypothetical protein